jgi:hypothetical protein
MVIYLVINVYQYFVQKLCVYRKQLVVLTQNKQGRNSTCPADN